MLAALITTLQGSNAGCPARFAVARKFPTDRRGRTWPNAGNLPVVVVLMHEVGYFYKIFGMQLLVTSETKVDWLTLTDLVLHTRFESANCDSQHHNSDLLFMVFLAKKSSHLLRLYYPKLL